MERFQKYVGLTPRDYPEIRDLRQLNELGLVWMIEPGSTQRAQAETLNVPFREVTDLAMKNGLQMIHSKRNVFLRFASQEIAYFRTTNDGYLLDENRVRQHPQCCNDKSQPLFMGFSKRSSMIQVFPNEHYDEAIEIRPDNQRTASVGDTTAARLAAALLAMKEDGTTDRLVDQWESRYDL
ncbi:MAG: hypothetical protein ISP91_05570 [Pseudomonadales bacterium]|nr:hypothetical protein [Pseudomonadales bacterium]